jgi:hypothetical protein
MPMIDIYATAGTFPDIKNLAIDAAALVKSVEPYRRVGSGHQRPFLCLQHFCSDRT